MSKKQTNWTRAFNERAYDRLAITVPKGRKDDIEARAKGEGKSINGIVNILLRDYLGFTNEEWKQRKE